MYLVGTIKPKYGVYRLTKLACTAEIMEVCTL
jgi:hypothetical protein